MKRRIAKLACLTLGAVGFWRLLLHAERLLGRRRHAVVLLYHHIRDDNDKTPSLSLVEEGVTAAALEAQLSAFRHWYRPGTSSELAAALRGECALDDDSLVVTFDDGYRDNLTLAGPILRRHQLHGLIFIATGFIESQQRFWWIELNDAIRAMTPESLARARSLEGAASIFCDLPASADANNFESKRRLRMHVALRLGRLPFGQRHALLKALREASLPSATSLPLLDWNELNDISRDGFEVGAHTVNHPHLSRVSPEIQFQEIQESVECLTTRLGTRPTAFAYPHGDINETAEQTVRGIGFETAYAAHPGAATPGRTNPFRVPRIQLDAKDPATLEALIVIIKLGKYFPYLVGRILSKFFATQYEA